MGGFNLKTQRGVARRDAFPFVRMLHSACRDVLDYVLLPTPPVKVYKNMEEADSGGRTGQHQRLTSVMSSKESAGSFHKCETTKTVIPVSKPSESTGTALGERQGFIGIESRKEGKRVSNLSSIQLL